MKKIKQAYILNIIIFILEVIAIIWMESGIKIFNESNLFMASKIEMFKYFTVDSNILMCISSLLLAIEEKKVLYNKQDNISKKLYIFKLVSTVSVTLTMLITILFLAPKDGLIFLYSESNMLFHLINPLLSILVFVLFEKSKEIKFSNNVLSLIPVVLYAVYYIIMVLTHMDNGVIQKNYDWYGFFILGLNSLLIVPILIILFTYIISLILWKLNKEV